MEKNNTLIIVGAGAVENAWSPILCAFKKVMDNDVDIYGANTLFANYIYLLRAYSKIPVDKAKMALKVTLKDTLTLKRAICEEISVAQESGLLKPRKEFVEILRKVVSEPNSGIALISTNWDNVIDLKVAEFFRQMELNTDIRCVHIHGSFEYAEHLYLPSETTQENYRTNEENKNFGLNHLISINLLASASRIILYGISLDPLDAELCQNLCSAILTNNRLKEIVIINPKFKKIKSRIMAINILKRDIKIRCLKPEDITQYL